MMEEILQYIKNKKVVCPMPPEWYFLFKDIYGGFNKIEAGERELEEYKPLILSGWDAYDEESNKELDKVKHWKFIESIKYFYEKYPYMRSGIEFYVFNLEDEQWFYGNSPNDESNSLILNIDNS